MYHIRILDRDRQIQAILPDVQWSYTRRINEATEITIQIPRETVGEYITPEHVLFGFFSPTQPIAVGAAPVSTRPDKAQHAQIAAFIQVYQGTQLRASGCITGRELGQTITVAAMTEEILLEQIITPAQYGRVWDGWDLADVARDLLDGWHSIRVKAQSQWQSYMVASSHVDLNTEPGVVMLAKQADGRYYESGYITLLFDSGEISDFKQWDRVRWSADSNEVVQTSIQISYDGSTWSQEIDGGLPEEIGYALGSSASQVYVRINLHTIDTESEDPNGQPVGVTPYVFAVELIGRTQGHLVAGNIPASAGVTVKGLDADHANALQVLIDACEQNSWEFSVWNGALSIAQALGVDRTADFVLRGGTNMEIVGLGDDDSELCNDLIAYGPGQGLNRLEITLKDDQSISAYGKHPEAMEFDVDTLSELEDAAQEYLDTHNTPKTHFEVRAAFDYDHEPEYALGDVVCVADPDTGIVTTTRIMTESREYGTSGLTVRLDLGRARLNLQRVLEGGRTPPKPVDPLTPTGVWAKGIIKGIRVGCSAPKGDWANTECHVSTASGFTPASTTLVASGRQTSFDIVNFDPGVRYYARLIHIDSSGRRSEPSREVSAAAQYVPVEAIPDYSLGVEKFVTSLRPPQLVTTLPTLPDPRYPAGSLAYAIDQQKLFQTDGNTWEPVGTGTVTADEIVAGLVSVGGLNAGVVAVSAEGLGGKILIDGAGQRFIRKSDNKVMINFDAATGDAYFGGQLAAQSVTTEALTLRAITDFQYVTAQNLVNCQNVNWANIPGMSINVDAEDDTLLFVIANSGATGFAASSGSPASYVFTRLLVNGNVRQESSGSEYPLPPLIDMVVVPAGTHNIRVQWKGSGSVSVMGRTEYRGLFVLKLKR
jgi:hypothetical protein